MSVDTDANDTNLNSIRLLLSNFDVVLADNPLRCDCKIITFINMVTNLINDGKLSTDLELVQHLRCSKPDELYGFPVFDLQTQQDRLYCEYHDANCPAFCRCFQRLVTYVVIVDCSENQMITIPSYMPSNIIEVRIARNKIATIPMTKYLQFFY